MASSGHGATGGGRPSRELIVVAVLIASAGILGYLGFRTYYLALGVSQSVSNLLYLTLQLFVIKSGHVEGTVPLTLNVARFLAPVVEFLAIAAVLATVFRDRLSAWRLHRRHDHIVVCGLGRRGQLLIGDLLARGQSGVGVDRDAEVAAALEAELPHVAVVVGDARDAAVLRRAGVARARRLVALCDSDGSNVAVAVAAERVPRAGDRARLVCHVHLGDFDLWRLLRVREIPAHTDAAGAPQLEFFNSYDAAAIELARQLRPAVPAAPAAASTSAASAQAPAAASVSAAATAAAAPAAPAAPAAEAVEASRHIVIVGFACLGRSLAIRLAHDAWLAGGAPEARPHITVVDEAATAKVAALERRFPALASSCEFVARDADVTSPAFEAAASLEEMVGAAAGRPAAIVVCFDDDARALQIGLLLRRAVTAPATRVVVRMATADGLATLLDAASGIEAFALPERSCTAAQICEGTHERIARAIHEEYLDERRRAGDTPADNPSLVPWPDLREELRESSRRQADDIGPKLALIGYAVAPLRDWSGEPLRFTPADVESLARHEHERWCGSMQGIGYRYSIGPKDPENRTHPDLIPWEQLSDEVREIDRAVVRAIPRVLARAGFSVCRVD